MAYLRDLWCSQLFRDVLHPLLLHAGPPALVPDAGDGHAEDPGAPASSTGGAAGEADTLAVQPHTKTSCNDRDLRMSGREYSVRILPGRAAPCSASASADMSMPRNFAKFFLPCLGANRIPFFLDVLSF